MSTMTLEQVLADPNGSLDRACEQHDPLVIQREGKDSVIVIRARDICQLRDDPGMAETLFLLSDPRNASELLESIAAANRGEVTEHELIDE
jgi:antitoxin YefM